MLSYRHGFHAGNAADILKHVTLVLIIDYLKKKPAPVRYIDTHAGGGVYPVDGPMALKTGEFSRGVGCLDLDGLAAAPDSELGSYVDTVKGYLSHQRYPGSPALAAKLLRPQDEIRLFELHSAEYPFLLKSLGQDRRTRIFHEDGYDAPKALLPVQNARALVLIDPSYENSNEYNRIVDSFKKGYARMPTAIFAIWYPVVDRELLDTMVRKIAAAVPAGLNLFELSVDNEESSTGMKTSGMLVVNPPWTLRHSLDEAFKLICPQLAQGNPGNTKVNFSSRELK